MLTSNFFFCTPLCVNSDSRRFRIQNVAKKKVNNDQKLLPLALDHSHEYHASNNIRWSVDFKPSIWGNRFLEYASLTVEDSEDSVRHAEKLRVEIKRMLTSAVIDPSEKLELIDMVQRLGLSYHFAEINEVLQDIHTSQFRCEDNLHIIALRFRLLRQQGNNVSCDVFNRFKDHEGKLKKHYANDAQGLLSLYEASVIRVHGEDFLEEALNFTTTHLESLATRQTPTFAARIKHVLKWPIGKAFPRLEARQNLTFYEANSSRERLVLEFAKIDFNRVQRLHQRELGQINMWWSNLDFANKLPFVRDRIVESYFWALGAYFEPQYSLARKMLTKVIAFLTIIDDIYDSYGTFEELELFTEALQSWDIVDINMLPKYMRPVYKAILEVYNEIENTLDHERKLCRAVYVKELMERQVRALSAEAKWFRHQHIPSMEEYMEVASITVGFSAVGTTSLLGMEDITTESTIAWISSRPKIVKAAETIIRLMNDIVDHMFDQSNGHIISSIECYKKQYGTSHKETIDELQKQITSAWKDINQECLHPTVVPIPVLQRVIGLLRVANILYQEEDGFTNGVLLEGYMVSLFVDPV